MMLPVSHRLIPLILGLQRLRGLAAASLPVEDLNHLLSSESRNDNLLAYLPQLSDQLPPSSASTSVLQDTHPFLDVFSQGDASDPANAPLDAIIAHYNPQREVTTRHGEATAQIVPSELTFGSSSTHAGPFSATSESVMLSHFPFALPPLGSLAPDTSISLKHAELEKVRDAIYFLAGMIKNDVRTRPPIIAPYRGHLTRELNFKFVSDMAVAQKRPWLWTVDGKRYLLRQSWPNSQAFLLANGFKTNDYYRVFFDVWREVGTPGSEIFDYVGTLRGPSRSNSGYRRLLQSLDAYTFPIHQYDILGPSTFTTKRSG